LLPSLLKEANSLRSLGYQVAPGVAEVSGDAVAELELQAAQAVYVVDDDQGGRSHAAKLRDAGIEADRILVLGSGIAVGYSIEDLVRKSLYAAAVNTELDRSDRDDRIRVNDVPDKGRSAAVRKWCETRDYSEPRKVNVATNIAIDGTTQVSMLTPIGRKILQELHAGIEARIGKAPDRHAGNSSDMVDDSPARPERARRGLIR
jgi:hypothetical protein